LEKLKFHVRDLVHITLQIGRLCLEASPNSRPSAPGNSIGCLPFVGGPPRIDSYSIRQCEIPLQVGETCRVPPGRQGI
jgi:hypothetical protein